MISLSQVMVSLYSHSFLFDPVFRLLLASGLSTNVIYSGPSNSLSDY